MWNPGDPVPRSFELPCGNTAHEIEDPVQRAEYFVTEIKTLEIEYR